MTSFGDRNPAGPFSGRPGAGDDQAELTWDEMAALSEASLAPGSVRDNDGQGIASHHAADVQPSASYRPDTGQDRFRIRLQLLALLGLFAGAGMVTVHTAAMAVSLKEREVVEKATAVTDQVALTLVNGCEGTVFIRIGSRLIALDSGQSMRKALPTGIFDFSWWEERSGTPGRRERSRERLTGDAEWRFELIYLEGKPVLLRTVAAAPSET